MTVWGGGGEARRPARLTRGVAERVPREEGGRGAVGSCGVEPGETKEGDGDDGTFLWESSSFFCSNWVSALMRLCTMAEMASCWLSPCCPLACCCFTVETRVANWPWAPWTNLPGLCSWMETGPWMPAEDTVTVCC